MESGQLLDKRPGGNRQRGAAFCVATAILLAMGLRTIHYVANPSMWYDELAIARNISDRGITELITEPLDHYQIAPIGFLVASKISTVLLGENEYALRLMPWTFAVIAPMFFWLIARRFIKGAFLFGGLLLFAVSPALSWYGGNVKQYSSDITISMILVWLALRFREKSIGTASAVLVGLCGGLLITCSQPAVVTAFLLCTILVIERWIRPTGKPLSRLAILVGGWGLGALIATVFALQTVDAKTMDHMKNFWSEGFPPTESTVAFVMWYPTQISQTFGVFLFHIAARMAPLAQIAIALTVLAIPGLIHLVRRDRWSTALLMTPLIGALVAATIHLFPFRHRVGLHACWPILLLAMSSFGALRNLFPRAGRWLVPVALVVIVGLPSAAILAVGRPPYRGHQEMRPLLKEFAEHLEPGDAVYVFHGARHAMHFYGPALEIDPDDWTEGGIHYGDNRAYLREIDALRGKSRVWFVYTQMLRYKAPRDIVAYLNRIGVQRELLVDPYGQKGQSESAAYLFDLSDKERLARDTAESFSLAQ